jgi:hypothetical protein
MLSEKRYKFVSQKCRESAIDTLWEIFNPSHDSWTGFNGLGFEKFLNRREVFLWMLERLLREGCIKLHKNGVFLKSSIEDQIKLFKEAFPKDEPDADRICTKPGMEIPYEGFGMNVWWFLDSCPAGVAWRQADGHYEIID